MRLIFIRHGDPDYETALPKRVNGRSSFSPISWKGRR